MKINSYPGKCQSCSNAVGPGKGFIYKNGNSWLVVCASTACHRRLGLNDGSPAAVDQTRRLNADGSVQMPFDREAIPLLRSMPGARWNPDAKRWTVSLKPADLPRVVELADKLKLEVAPELRAGVAEGTEESRAARERAKRDGLYPFQRTGVEFLALHRRALLGDDMGVGKTIQSIVALPDDVGAIVVCPAAVKYNWMDEFKKWRPEFKVRVLNGRNSFELPKVGEVVITNYDIMPKWLDPKATGQKTRTGKDVKRADIPEDVREALGHVALIIDEAQKVKNYKAGRSKRITELARLCAWSWMLTGTPLDNKPFDLYGILSSGDMAREVFSWSKFLQLFNGFKNRFGGYEFGNPMPEVPERLQRVMLRRTKAEVLPDLPSKRYQTLTTNGMDKRLEKELDEAWGELEDEFGEDESSRGNLPPFSRFSALRAKLASSRIPALIELVEEYEEAETPLLVFSAHREPITTIGGREGWGEITGDTSAKQRHEIVRAFQSGELKGVAMTIQAGGVGLTLTRAANAIFVDRSWKPADNLQAEDRMVRIGQTAAGVLIKVMTSNHPLDVHVSNLIQRKMDLIQRAIDSSITFKPPASTHLPNHLELVEETDEALKARLDALEAAEKQAEEDEARSYISGILGREQAKSDVPEPDLTLARKATLKDALSYMVGQCDGAIERDGIGFNKADAGIAHWINSTGMHVDDDITYRVLERILTRYHRQLKGKYDSIWKPDMQ